MKTFEFEVVQSALKKLFDESHFSICTVDKIGALIGTNPQKHPGYKWLNALHCVHYSEMSQSVRDELPRRVMEVLRPDSVNFEAMAMALTTEGRGHPPIEDTYLEADPKVSRLPWRR